MPIFHDAGDNLSSTGNNLEEEKEFMIAIRAGDVKAVTTFLHGYDSRLELALFNNNEPIRVASDRGYGDIISLLFAFPGVNPYVEDPELKLNAFELAFHRGQPYAFWILVSSQSYKADFWNMTAGKEATHRLANAIIQQNWQETRQELWSMAKTFFVKGGQSAFSCHDLNGLFDKTAVFILPSTYQVGKFYITIDEAVAAIVRGDLTLETVKEAIEYAEYQADKLDYSNGYAQGAVHHMTKVVQQVEAYRQAAPVVHAFDLMKAHHSSEKSKSHASDSLSSDSLGDEDMSIPDSKGWGCHLS